MKALLYPCLLSALASTSLAAVPQYKPRTDIVTGFKNLYGMAIADFNGDGKPDIAATDSNTNKLFVYLNDGTGVFGSPKSTSIPTAPATIAAGDFNEDGKQDLIVSVFSGSPLMLIGNGDGTFTQQQSSAAPGVATAVVDINQDKHLDVISGGNGSLSTYTGDGRGNFQQVPAFNYGSGGLFTSLASGDFNKDGKLDFVAVSPVQTAGIRYYAGYGDGTFASPMLLQNATLSAPGSIATADFDGDKNPDLLVSSGLYAYIVSGAGNGTFDLPGATKLLSPAFNITLPPGTNPIVSPWVTAVDLDGDGKTDVVTANTYITTLGVLVNDGIGKFPSSLADFTHTIDAGTSQLNTADLNGDGLPDIILANNTTQNISVFLSVKPRTLPEITVTPSVPSAFVGSAISVSVKVAGSGSIIPTGPVTLMDGSTSLGQQTLDANGQAIFPLTNLAAGYHTFSATYPGDTNYFQQNSILVGQSMWDMQIASTTPSQTVTAGATASYTLSVTPVGGLNGIITFTCSQLPSLATCDPVTVTPLGQPASATLTVRTTAPIRSQNSTSQYAFALLPLFAVCCVRRRRTFPPLFSLTLICALGFFATGCSSSKSSTTTPGTPSGSAQFTVTASITSGGQTLTRTTNATLIVQ